MLREYLRRALVWSMLTASRGHRNRPPVGNAEHLSLLDAGVGEWNRWRRRNPSIVPDLTGMHLCNRNLRGINLVGAQLQGACLNGTDLWDTSLDGADLRGAHLGWANLTNAHLARANLADAVLVHSNLSAADCEGVELEPANLSCCTLVSANLRDADLSGCRVYGISAWGVILDRTKQPNLIITPVNQPGVEVDNLELAQFLYLLLNNQKVRDVIDAITSKVVLLLGSFKPDRKKLLNALRIALRQHHYVPILFDFSRPANRDLTETIRTLGCMSRFVLIDITDARGVPQELLSIVPALPSVPVQPLLLASEREYGMFEHFNRFPSVLTTYVYHSEGDLLNSLVASPETLSIPWRRMSSYQRSSWQNDSRGTVRGYYWQKCGRGINVGVLPAVTASQGA